MYTPAIKWLGHIVLPRSVIPTFRPSVIIHFPIVISTTDAHTQLKFDTLMCLMNIQFEFEFSSGPMIFDRVMSLKLRKKMKNSQFQLSNF